MAISLNKIPAVISFLIPQTAISTLHALKHIKEVMESLDEHSTFVNDEIANSFQIAMDNLELLISAVE